MAVLTAILRELYACKGVACTSHAVITARLIASATSALVKPALHHTGMCKITSMLIYFTHTYMMQRRAVLTALMCEADATVLRGRPTSCNPRYNNTLLTNRET